MGQTFAFRRPRLSWFLSTICSLLLAPLLTVAYVASVQAADAGCTYVVPPTTRSVDGLKNYPQVKPGDTFCLPAGTRGNIKLENLNGTADKPITVRNSGGKVIITGKDILTGGISVINSSYLRVTGTGVSNKCGASYAPAEQECGIELDNTNKGIRVDTTDSVVHHFEFDHVYIHDVTTDTNSRGVIIHPLENEIIAGFYVHHNYIKNTKGEAIYVGTEPHGRPFSILGKMEDVDVSYNLIEQIGFDGIKVKVAIRNVKVHHNRIRNVGTLNVDNHKNGIRLAMSVGEVYNNYVETAFEGIGMGRPIPNPQTRYYNNVVVGAGHAGINVLENDALVYNNTVVRSGSMGIAAPGKDARVFDNIVVGTQGIHISGIGQNIFNNLTGTLAIAGFVNPAAGNYRLHANSLAVDRGRATGIFAPTDYEGRERPFGPRTDLGAYECNCTSAFIHHVSVPLIRK